MHICFTAQSILPYFDPAFPMENIGGAETQQYYLGKYLSENDVTVSFLSFDYGQKKIHQFGNIDFIKTYSMTQGITGLRFFYPRLSKIWQALKLADADIYYSRGAGFLPGILSIFCSIHRKKWVFAAASDTNFIPENLRLEFVRDKILYEYGLKRAHAIIAQSENQAKILKKNYRLDAVVINSIYPDEAKDSVAQRKHILWVGRLVELKRPELFVELAKVFPKENFIMIGGPGENRSLYADIKKATRDIPNLDFKGYLPFEETKTYFDRAKLFINTSIYEGFPNTFLQSWCRGIPVITFFDPDGVVGTKELGMVVSSPQELSQAVGKMISNYLNYSETIIQYFRDNHTPRIINRYLDIFQKLLK